MKIVSVSVPPASTPRTRIRRESDAVAVNVEGLRGAREERLADHALEVDRSLLVVLAEQQPLLLVLPGRESPLARLDQREVLAEDLAAELADVVRLLVAQLRGEVEVV